MFVIVIPIHHRTQSNPEGCCHRSEEGAQNREVKRKQTTCAVHCNVSVYMCGLFNVESLSGTLYPRCPAIIRSERRPLLKEQDLHQIGMQDNDRIC